MKILVSNDDGYRAPGLRALALALAVEFDITVVAPENNCSGASNSLSLNRPLQVACVAPGDNSDAGAGRDWPVYRVRGTPADSVHLAVNGMLDAKPDMVVAGVNHGANLGDDVLYSGTVAAAIEGRFLGLPALAVSLHGVDHDAPVARFESAAQVVVELLQNLRAKPLPKDTILNINVPDLPAGDMRGIRATRLGARHPAMPIIAAGCGAAGAEAERKTAAAGATRDFRIGSPGQGADTGPGTDFHAIAAGQVSVTPLHIDMTRHAALAGLADWLPGARA